MYGNRRGVGGANGQRAKGVSNESGGNGDGESLKRLREAERGLSAAVVAFAGRVPSGCDSKPIAATGVQQLPAFKSTPSHTQQMFTKAKKNFFFSLKCIHRQAKYLQLCILS